MHIVQGNVFGFWSFLLICGVTLTLIHLSRNEKVNIAIRRINGLDAIEESIGRATEMGKPVHFTPGLADIVGNTAAKTFAALEVLSYVTDLSARYNAELVVTIRQPNVLPLAQETVRQGYMTAGRPDMYQEDTVRFFSSNQNAYATGVVGYMHRAQVAANIMAGYYMGEALILAEAGSQVGAMQIAITASMAQLPFFVAACDYTIIGEELFAAGAYVSQDRIKLGGIAAQDFIKLGVMAIVIIGTIMASSGSNAIQELLVK